MALFTDSELLTISDLEIYEATLGQIASSHGLNVESKIAVSLGRIGDRLMGRLLRSGASDPQHRQRQRLGLSTVVVTAALQRWLCYDVLAQFFSEAYSLQLNDRFKGKLTDYTKRANEAEDLYYQLGIGIVFDPLPRPGMPEIAVYGGIAPAEIITVQCAWIDANSNESELSLLAPLNLPDGSAFSVSTLELPSEVPVAAVGWNVYISLGGEVTRQNLTPIPIGTVWSMPDAGFLSGPLPLNGQSPDYYITECQRIVRG